MNRTQAIQSLTVQETILNALQGQRNCWEGKLNWVAGEEWEEVKARIESLDRAIAYTYKLEA